MKKTLSLLLSVLLTVSLCLPSMAEGTAEKHVKDYADEIASIQSIFSAGEQALEDGMDPKRVGEEMYGLADANNMLPYFTYACENAVSYETTSYNRLLEFCGRESSQKQIDVTWENPELLNEDISFYAYGYVDCSEAMKSVLADAGAEFCMQPYFWTESDINGYYGTPFSKFKPARPREGYVCVIVRDSAENAPETAWNKGDGSIFQDALRTTVNDLMWALGDDAPVLTGNPNLAASFWIFDLSFPFYSVYTNRADRSDSYKGYNCVASLSVMPAGGKKAAAEIKQKNTLPRTLGTYYLYNGAFKADTPVLSQTSSYQSFTGKVRAALQKERSAARANRKMTPLNAESVLKSVLINQTAKLNDNWQKAIYESGARDVSLDGDTLTFTLRSYDPKLTELGSRADAADKDAWLTGALERAAQYDLKMTLTVENGQLTKKSLQTLQSTVKKAASAAQKAFSGKDMTQALKEYFFPVPITERIKDAAPLENPPEAFLTAVRSKSGVFGSGIPDAALSAFFYAQKSQALNVKGGPHEMILACVGVDPAAMLNESVAKALDESAYLPAASRDSGDEADSVFIDKIVEYAFQNKSKVRNKVNLTIDIDVLADGRLPGEYAEYAGAFAYEEALDDLQSSVSKLPDMAALTLPANGKMSGGDSGTQVRIRTSKTAYPTYIQIRDNTTDKVLATAFVLPGKTASVRVPQGWVYYLYASGPYWYGETTLFGDLGSYNKSESLEILSNRYIHTWTLEVSEDGNVSVTGSDPSAFQ